MQPHNLSPGRTTRCTRKLFSKYLNESHAGRKNRTMLGLRKSTFQRNDSVSEKQLFVRRFKKSDFLGQPSALNSGRACFPAIRFSALGKGKARSRRQLFAATGEKT